MNIVVMQDAAGGTYFDPAEVECGAAATSISVTMVPPTGASWTITAVASDPSASWSNNTAVLPEGGYYITVTASDSSKSGTSAIRVTGGFW